MIDRKSRRVVIINNIQSDTIDQAIFILKSNKNSYGKAFSEENIVSEAQDIINSYIRQVEHFKEFHRDSPSSKKQKNSFLSHMLTVALTAVFMLAVFFIAAYNL